MVQYKRRVGYSLNPELRPKYQVVEPVIIPEVIIAPIIVKVSIWRRTYNKILKWFK